MSTNIRRVFSGNVPERGLAADIEKQASAHPKGMSGYIRDLVALDRIKWQHLERIRQQALTKLSDYERGALGYPKT